MYKGLQGVDKLVLDLQREKLLQSYVIGDKVVSVCVSKLLILIYLPQSCRLEDRVDMKTIHLDVDLLNNSYLKVWQRIRGLMGMGMRLYARECVVARIDKRVALEFLEEHHLNDALSGKYRYGLFYNGELVSVAVFSGGRIMRNISAEYRSFELVRFCHKADYLVVGGISKLVKAFVKDFKPSDIMTYSDRDWSQHSTLEAIGFKKVGIVSEQLFKVKDGKRLTFDIQDENYDYCIKNKGSIKLKLYL